MGLFSNNYREEYDYLLLNQPKPTKAVLANDTYLKYSRSDCAESSCFEWTQPLKFVVDNKYSQWNELFLDSKSFSDILKFVKNSNCLECIPYDDGCFCLDFTKTSCDLEQSCDPFKYSLTASNIKSDINLYTDFWEKTTSIYYFSQNEFTLSANLKYFDYPENTISVDYTEKSNLFTNLGNDNFAQTIAWFANKDQLVNEKELGFFIPDVYSYGKWNHTITNNVVSSINNTRGNLLKYHKEHVDVFDIDKKDCSGLGYSDCKFEGHQTIISDVKYDQCGVESLSSNEIDKYCEDVFGNRYYLVKDNTLLNTIQYRNDSNTGIAMVETVSKQFINISDLFFDNVFFEDASNIVGLTNAIKNGEISRIEVFYDTLIVIAYDYFGIFQLYMDYETGNPYIIPDNSYCFTGANMSYYLDRSSKQIYFVSKNTTTSVVNAFTYNLNDNKIYVDYDNYIPNSSFVSSSLCYDEVTQILYYHAIVSFPSTTLKGLACVKYKKIGSRFEYLESVLIERFGGLNGRGLLRSKVDPNGNVQLILSTAESINVINYHE